MVFKPKLTVLSTRDSDFLYHGALSTPDYLLALLRELSYVPRGLQENAEAKQVRKTNRTDILYQIGKMVRTSILTFRTQDFIDFDFEGIRSTLKL